jgi:hypothetical protein
VLRQILADPTAVDPFAITKHPDLLPAQKAALNDLVTAELASLPSLSDNSAICMMQPLEGRAVSEQSKISLLLYYAKYDAFPESACRK